MISFELIAIFTKLQFPESRLSGTKHLATYAGAESTAVFGKDCEVDVFLPALGMPQTLRSGIKWTVFLNQCAQSGIHAATVPRQDGSETVAIGLADTSRNAVIVFLGCKEIDHPIQREILALLPLLGAKLVAERSALAAEGRATAARHASQVASELTTILDANRRELQTAWHSAEAEIKARRGVEEKLRDADRRKDEFLAMLGHELRNPLAPIGAAAQLLRTARLDEERVRKASDVIIRQVEHMTGLVNDLLDVSRVTRGLATIEKTPIEIRTIVTDALEQVAPLIHARRHHLTLELAPGAAIVDVDRKRLVQVIANVLNNAAKYTPEDGRICLRTEVQGASVLIEVTDNGIGMTSGLTSRVFDLFTQAHATPDRNSGGLGLGLALVKSLVELHGGSVAASSNGLGQGSRFVMHLPRAPNSVASDTSTGVTSTSDTSTLVTSTLVTSTLLPAETALKILVVDDNVDAAETIAMLLEASGNEVYVEHGAKSALERTAKEKPDVCLLDIGLPEMDGNELARRIRKLPGMATVVLIALTGYGQEDDQANTRAAGFNHHFVKPVDTAKLNLVLERVTSMQ